MPEETKYGIENLKKIFALGFELGSVAGDVAEKAGNAELKWYDKWLFPFTKLGDEIFAMFSVDYKLIVPEWKDLDEVEKAELKVFAQEKFDIPQDEIEGVIEEVLLACLALGEHIVKLVEVAKTFKKKD